MRKLLEAWVGAQRIEARPYQHTWVKSLCVAFFEPIHRFIHIPKRHMTGMRGTDGVTPIANALARTVQ